jgi:hypothetical protein
MQNLLDSTDSIHSIQSPKPVNVSSPGKVGWRMSTNVSSPTKTGWRMSTNVSSPTKTGWRMSGNVSSPTNFPK